jgi:phenylacetate-coenzyme A ligase PaaK-like adenylate-forming protein
MTFNDEWLQTGSPYSLGEEDKRRFLLPRLDQLTRHHYEHCASFRSVVERVFGGLRKEPYENLADLPFLPVSLFKERELRSVPSTDVFKVLTSSGTTGQSVSRIYLDRQTADLQAKVLVKISQHFLGKNRLPMVVLDSPSVVKDRTSFSARGAGILGMMQFGRLPCYALDEGMNFDVEKVQAYLLANQNTPVLFFGFTFIAWIHAIKALESQGKTLPKNQGILVHSGGWKKLEAEKVSPAQFSEASKRTLGVHRVLNFYGMVEQVGSIFYENQLGFLQAPLFADILVRDPHTLRPLPPGQTGLLQVFSILPRSYPGHSLLTADLGRLCGVDDPNAGALGRFFEVQGRAPRAEIRGCSDTYEQAKP